MIWLYIQQLNPAYTAHMQAERNVKLVVMGCAQFTIGVELAGPCGMALRLSVTQLDSRLFVRTLEYGNSRPAAKPAHRVELQLFQHYAIIEQRRIAERTYQPINVVCCSARRPACCGMTNRCAIVDTQTAISSSVSSPRKQNTTHGIRARAT